VSRGQIVMEWLCLQANRKPGNKSFNVVRVRVRVRLRVRVRVRVRVWVRLRVSVTCLALRCMALP
jgi:hypothetical protein